MKMKGIRFCFYSVSWMCIQVDTKSFFFITIKGKIKSLHKPSVVWQVDLKLTQNLACIRITWGLVKTDGWDHLQSFQLSRTWVRPSNLHFKRFAGCADSADLRTMLWESFARNVSRAIWKGRVVGGDEGATERVDRKWGNLSKQWRIPLITQGRFHVFFN